jgi:competence protein ComEC
MKNTLILSCVFALLAVGALGAADTLDIYFIDVEGGQATLLVTPSGEAMMIDVGNAGLDSQNPDKEIARDANRIAVAAKAAGVKRIEAVIITHFHGDHFGGILHLTERIPVARFYDHGFPVQDAPALKQKVGSYAELYTTAIAKGQHKVVVPGEKIPMKDLKVTILSSAGKPIANTGPANPYCEGLVPQPITSAPEDAQSMAVLVEFSEFRFLVFESGVFNVQLEVLCPNNPIGQIDVLEAPSHGGNVPMKAWNAVAPRVAIGSNSPRRGAGTNVLQGYRSLQGFEDLWLLHFNIAAGVEGNPPEQFIANMDELVKDMAHYIKLSAMPDGSFTVHNTRTNFSKSYPAKKRP